MADYRKLLEQELLKQQNQQSTDPLQQRLENEIMQKNELSGMAPTVALSDQLFGTRLSNALPKEESMKDKLAQVLAARQAAQAQRMGGLGKLAQMQDAREMRAQELQHKKDMYNLQMLMAKGKLANAGQPKLGSEDKKALGYTQSLMRNLQDYKKMVKNGGIRPEMWSSMMGDTPTMAIRKALVENYGRLQSGGAISGDEEKRFGSLFGSMMDSPEVIQQKLARIEAEINEKNALYGGGNYSAPAGADRAPSNGLPAYSDDMSDEQVMALGRMKGY